ncbi:unnamed protein product, partial [Lymnaea stagnalis]
EGITFRVQERKNYGDLPFYRTNNNSWFLVAFPSKQTIMEFSQLFPLLQFTDSAFPTGGFSHSQGIEAFIQHYHHVGMRKDHKKLFNAFICILENSGSLHLPFVSAAHAIFQDLTTQAAEAGEPPATCSVQSKNGEIHSPANELNQLSGNGCSELAANKCTELTNDQCSTDRLQSSLRQLVDLDKTFEACSTNHISRRASARQGKSFIEVLKLIYKDLYFDLMSALSELPHGHYPVVYGAVMSAIGVDSDAAIGSFMFCVVRGLITSAVRLDVLGAMEGQKLQCSLQQTIADIVAR